jgi:hypothetical protein
VGCDLVTNEISCHVIGMALMPLGEHLGRVLAQRDAGEVLIVTRLTVLSGFAEFERELIRARAAGGRERAKARGVQGAEGWGMPLRPFSNRMLGPCSTPPSCGRTNTRPAQKGEPARRRCHAGDLET